MHKHKWNDASSGLVMGQLQDFIAIAEYW